MSLRGLRFSRDFPLLIIYMYLEAVADPENHKTVRRTFRTKVVLKLVILNNFYMKDFKVLSAFLVKFPQQKKNGKTGKLAFF